MDRRVRLSRAGLFLPPPARQPCRRGFASARAAEGTTLRVAYPLPVATLDPAKFRVGGLEYNYAHCVFNRLTAQDNKLQVIPDLAQSWDASEDLKVWTFHLRPGVKFHDGKPFTAADVLFTYKRLMDKDVGSVVRASLSVVDKIEAVDPLTVRFTLSSPYSDLAAVTAAIPDADRQRIDCGHVDHQADRDGSVSFRRVSPGRSVGGGEEPGLFRARFAQGRPRRHAHYSGIHHVGRRVGERGTRPGLRSTARADRSAQGQQGSARRGGRVR